MVMNGGMVYDIAIPTLPLMCHQTEKNWSVTDLVDGSATPLKNMKVNWDDHSEYMGK